MANKTKTYATQKGSATVRKATPVARSSRRQTQQANVAQALARALTSQAISPADILTLQQVAGNRAVKHLLAERMHQQPSRLTVQAKFFVGAADDHYEREADRVAATVMQTSEPAAPATIQRQASQEADEEMIQPKPLVSSITPLIQRQEMPEQEDEETTLIQRRGSGGPTSVDSNVAHSIERARTNGQSLPPNVRARMERSFGVDFRQVRVHADSQADGLNGALQSRAFTTGRDIFFRRGAYDPASRQGQQLIAHELTHVIQQSGGSSRKSGLSIQRAPGNVIQRSVAESLQADREVWKAMPTSVKVAMMAAAPVIGALAGGPRAIADFYRDLAGEDPSTGEMILSGFVTTVLSPLSFAYGTVKGILNGLAFGIGNPLYSAGQRLLRGLGWALNGLVAGAQWAGRNFVAGVRATGRGIAAGARWAGRGLAAAGRGLVRGAQWTGRQAVAGARWTGRQAVAGARWAGRKIVAGARATGRAVVAGGRALIAGARWAGRNFVAGVRATGRGIAAGARWAGRGLAAVGRGLVRGAQRIGRGIAAGARWTGRQVVEGAQWVGREVQEARGIYKVDATGKYGNLADGTQRDNFGVMTVSDIGNYLLLATGAGSSVGSFGTQHISILAWGQNLLKDTVPMLGESGKAISQMGAISAGAGAVTSLMDAQKGYAEWKDSAHSKEQQRLGAGRALSGVASATQQSATSAFHIGNLTQTGVSASAQIAAGGAAIATGSVDILRGLYGRSKATQNIARLTSLQERYDKTPALQDSAGIDIVKAAKQGASTQEMRKSMATGTIAKGLLTTAGGVMLAASLATPIGWALLGVGAVVGGIFALTRYLSKRKRKEEVAMRELNVTKTEREYWKKDVEKIENETKWRSDDRKERLARLGAEPLQKKLAEHGFKDAGHFYGNYLNYMANHLYNEGISGKARFNEDAMEAITERRVRRQLSRDWLKREQNLGHDVSVTDLNKMPHKEIVQALQRESITIVMTGNHYPEVEEVLQGIGLRFDWSKAPPHPLPEKIGKALDE